MEFFKGRKFVDFEKPPKSPPDPRQTVLNTVENSLSLFNDPSFTIIRKKTKTQPERRTAPSKCWWVRTDGRCQVFVPYARSNLTMNGKTAIDCKLNEVADVHKEIIAAIKGGYFDDQLAKRSADFRNKMSRNR